MLQCFTTYVAVLGPHDPPMIPEMMAYLRLIVQVSQDFEGLAWVRYDVAFRRQAALTGNRKWSAINTTLYSMCFTGRATRARRCDLYPHRAGVCPTRGSGPRRDLPNEDPGDSSHCLGGARDRGLCRGVPSSCSCRPASPPIRRDLQKMELCHGVHVPPVQTQPCLQQLRGGSPGHPLWQATSGDARTRSHVAIRGHTTDPPILGTPGYQG